MDLLLLCLSSPQHHILLQVSAVYLLDPSLRFQDQSLTEEQIQAMPLEWQCNHL